MALCANCPSQWRHSAAMGEGVQQFASKPWSPVGRWTLSSTTAGYQGQVKRHTCCWAKRSNKSTDLSAPQPTRSSEQSAQSDGDGDDSARPPYTRQRVVIQSLNQPLRAILHEVNDGKLNLQPEYQRDFVWDDDKCMGLLKTVYEGLPVPAVMLYQRLVEGQGTRHEVVDGKQRLVTLYVYMQGDNSDFPKAPLAIKLDPEDELYDILHGKKFRDLSREDQENMRDFLIQVQYIPSNTPPRTVYRIYENINAGGMEHSAQQLRRAAFYGPYIKLLTRLATPTPTPTPNGPKPVGQLLHDLAALTEDEEKAQQAEELVLRFFAVRNAARNHKPFRRPMKEFLHEELQREDSGGRKVLWEPPPSEQARMEKEFTRTVRLLWDLGLKEVAEEVLREMGAKVKSFRRWGSTTGAGPLWDTALVGLSQALDRMPRHGVFTRNAAALRAGFRDLLLSPRWSDVSTTFSKKTQNARLEAFEQMVVEPALRDELQRQSSTGRRTFSRTEKQAMFDRQPDPTCAWCGKPIVTASHAEMDHVVPYALGGETSLDNAQLLHSSCNRERGTRPMDEGPAARAAMEAAAAKALAAAAAGQATAAAAGQAAAAAEGGVAGGGALEVGLGSAAVGVARAAAAKDGEGALALSGAGAAGRLKGGERATE